MLLTDHTISTLRIKETRKALTANGIVFFALDQHMSIRKKQGISVPFFEKNAGTPRSLAIFAHASKAVVLSVSSYRKPNGKHVIEFQPQIEWQTYPDPQQAIYENTRLYNQRLEETISAHPEQ
jgi:KDO2-lipid IV(A) lauroyltransferase